MGIFFANPWGLLALLGVPVVVAIHLLRRKSRQVRVSTLFLVERALPSSEGGRRIRTLRNSLPLWAQILAVCALTWLLAQPRWIDQSSVQTVVAVFDSSASMSAFRDETLAAARVALSRLGESAARTQWIFLRSDASRLTAGVSLDDALTAVASSWLPSLGTHDTGEAFRLARTLAGEKGSILFLTDRPPPEADGVGWIASGDRIDNAGFLGGESSEGHWRALLKNFGPAPRDIRWRIVGTDEWKTTNLAAGAMTEIAGPFPAGADRVMLEIEGDRFAFDDRMPILSAKPKALVVQVRASEAFRELFAQLQRLAAPVATSPVPDVALDIYNPLAPQMPAGAAVIFVEDAGTSAKPLSGLVVGENHPLMENLNWQGLVARDTFGVPFREGDVALLWQGERPLIFLRTHEGKPQLVFNFDVRQSNAARLPAFPLLLHRFFALLREDKPAYEAVNGETRQTFMIAGVGTVVAPDHPDFFSAKTADGTVIFDGAAQFGDTRESDFSAASRGRSAESAAGSIRETNARGEALDPVWALVLGGLMFWNWLLTGRPKDRAAGGTELKLAR